MIKGILFDIDGTLVDSNDAHALAWVEALKEAKIPADLTTIRKMIGMGGDQLLPKVGIFPENERFSQLQKRRGEIFRTKYLSSLQAFDGAKALLERVKDKGLKFAAATSASSKDLGAILKQCDLEGYFRNYTTSDDAALSKPEPDILLTALEMIHLAPEEAILVGDTPYDIYSGKRAGLETIAFTCGGWSEQELLGAVAIYHGPRHLLDAWKSSALSTAKAA